MAAYRIPDWLEPASIVEVEVPVPGPGQVRVRGAWAGRGLCHSDLAMGLIPADLGAAMGWQVPFTLGHETAGWVDALGPGVVDLAGGKTPVAVASPASCGTCRWCRGAENACPNGVVGRAARARNGDRPSTCWSTTPLGSCSRSVRSTPPWPAR